MNEQAVTKRNLTPFWILLAVTGLPYLLSWIYFGYVDRQPVQETGNRGELIQPVRSLGDLSLQLVDGSRLDVESLKGNWTLVSTGASACEQRCQQNLFFMRQVRRLMGEDRTRIKRLFLLQDSAQLDGFQAKAEPYGEMILVSHQGGDNAQLREQLTINGVTPTDRIFIVDPMANLMMAYAPDSDPEDIAKDFRRLLNVVRIGQPKSAG